MSQVFYGDNYNVNTAIAFSFYDLGLLYQNRCNYNLAIDNYRKALDYDGDLKYVSNTLNALLKFVNRNNSNVCNLVES